MRYMTSNVLPIRIGQRANECIPETLNENERADMINEVAMLFADLLDRLHINHRDDHNTRDTPLRVARMYVNDIMRGRFASPPVLTDFENVQAFDQLIVIGPIEVRSTCAHHLMPIYGEAFVAVQPGPTGRIIGLSKYDRIIDYFAGRLQIQEELVQQVGQYIMEQTRPEGLAVRISAVHMCKTHRGVRANHRSRMVTNAYFGTIAKDPYLKDEFLRECNGLAFGPSQQVRFPVAAGFGD
jgi:GTP cyclohydrolase I